MKTGEPGIDMSCCLQARGSGGVSCCGVRALRRHWQLPGMRYQHLDAVHSQSLKSLMSGVRSALVAHSFLFPNLLRRSSLLRVSVSNASHCYGANLPPSEREGPSPGPWKQDSVAPDPTSLPTSDVADCARPNSNKGKCYPFKTWRCVRHIKKGCYPSM